MALGPARCATGVAQMGARSFAGRPAAPHRRLLETRSCPLHLFPILTCDAKSPLPNVLARAGRDRLAHRRNPGRRCLAHQRHRPTRPPPPGEHRPRQRRSRASIACLPQRARRRDCPRGRLNLPRRSRCPRVVAAFAGTAAGAESRPVHLDDLGVYGEEVADFAAAHPGRVRTVVLLVTPPKLTDRGYHSRTGIVARAWIILPARQAGTRSSQGMPTGSGLGSCAATSWTICWTRPCAAMEPRSSVSPRRWKPTKPPITEASSARARLPGRHGRLLPGNSISRHGSNRKAGRLCKSAPGSEAVYRPDPGARQHRFARFIPTASRAAASLERVDECRRTPNQSPPVLPDVFFPAAAI